MTRKKRFYSNEFKEKAIAISYQRENLKELADELGIKVERIYKWRRSQTINIGYFTRNFQNSITSI
jgi:transposase-like protein